MTNTYEIRRWLLGFGWSCAALFIAAPASAQPENTDEEIETIRGADGEEIEVIRGPKEESDALRAINGTKHPLALLSLPEKYRPVLSLDIAEMQFAFPLSVRGRGESVSSFPIDRNGTRYKSDPALNIQLRAGFDMDTVRAIVPFHVVLKFEIDALSGQPSGGVDEDLAGVFLPNSRETETVIRHANARLDIGPAVHLFGGLTTSQWGMGLLANDGDQRWTPGSALFTDPRGGDRVLRGLVSVGPFFDENLLLAVGIDAVQGDDVLLEEKTRNDVVLREADEAKQAIASLVYGFGKPSRFGAYFAARRQTTEDDKRLDVNVLDVTGRWETAVGTNAKFIFEGEMALIFGETELGPTVDHPVHNVRQIGAATRMGLDLGRYGFVLDLLWASGDNNFDDSALTGFKTDVNYPLGLITHRYVMAAQTARTPVTASDPELVGIPSDDLERLPTRGSITNTIAIFPRLWGRPLRGLELYGGPLFAFAERAPADPFTSRLNGGTPTNALDGEPGSYLGTEFDVGIRYQRLLASSELTFGLEGGIFVPGSAFDDKDGASMELITAGRLMAGYRF